MRFTFTTAAIVVLGATAFSGAAVIPRANVDIGLETRYYRGGHYAREVPATRTPQEIQLRFIDDEDSWWRTQPCWRRPNRS
ncbi:hypothetical protein D9615_005750 [Tricholomella constricta]|uniref:Uncharacterized protein n=1 Tax=Tricholomella constricta TaxID=117010 RepID=A0A8H5M3R1_9AGAR|nr:hypothetical protein D9615_005750 [Tricholomella constricta]